IAAPPVVGVLERGPVCVRNEQGEDQPLEEGRNPPCVAPLGGGEASAPKLFRHSNHRVVSPFLGRGRAQCAGASGARSRRAGLRATVVRLGDMSAQLACRLWDDAQTLVRGRTPREAASRLAAGALDASAEARRQAEELLRRLGGQSSRLVAGLESDVARLAE